MIIRNIENKVKLATFVSVGSLLASVAISFLVSLYAYRQVSNARKSVYVLDANSIPLLIRQADIKVNRVAEYKAHINLFHSLFFSVTPDEKFIEYQMKKAMYLIDESGALQYNNLKEKGYFNSILSSSAVLTLQTDSILVDEGRKYFRYYGKQKIDRRSSFIIRSLVTEGNIQDLEVRSDNNPHAALIIHWKTIENKDLENAQKNTF
ncbi:conjugative transposon protein TraK [Desertivirga brevis]|uniref:conjugative transposon protein TraK n=1 Tax=Desertivirga brevis TaxID=2810310 RepID=UPI001A9609F4|nr:conjugative transposon protein TraK [Pedobacter sp. SYSU D00873]